MLSKKQQQALDDAENQSIQLKHVPGNKILIDKAAAKLMRTDFEKIGLGFFHPRLKVTIGTIEKRLMGFSFPKKEIELALYGKELTDDNGSSLTTNTGIYLAFGKHSETEGGEITLILYGLSQTGKLNEDDNIFDYSQACPNNCPDSENGIQFPDFILE